MNEKKYVYFTVILFFLLMSSNAIAEFNPETFNFYYCNTKNTVKLPATVFTWNWSEFETNYVNEIDASTCNQYYCDATQTSISIIERIHEYKEDPNKTYLLTFNAFLVEDGYSKDFKKDFTESTQLAFFNAPEWFKKEEYDKLFNNTIFDLSGIKGAGKYQIKINLKEDNTTRIEFNKTEEPSMDYPLLHIAFNDELGTEDKTRNGYGSWIKPGEEIQVNSNIAPRTFMYNTGEKCLASKCISVKRESEKGIVFELNKIGAKDFELFFDSKNKKAKSIEDLFEPHYDYCIKKINKDNITLKKQEREVMITSDNDWRTYLQLVPLAVKKGVPLLIYHQIDREIWDLPSLIYFLNQHHPTKITVFSSEGEQPKIFNETEYEGIAEYKSITESYWEWKPMPKHVVFIPSDNYKAALMASSYAGLIGAPLFFVRDLDTGEKLLKNLSDKGIIGKGTSPIFVEMNVGSFMPPSNQQFLRIVQVYCKETAILHSVSSLQEEFVHLTRTDKIILVNPNDIKKEYSQEGIYGEVSKSRYSDVSTTGIRTSSSYYKDSIAAPLLAAAKKEVMVFVETPPAPRVHAKLFKAYGPDLPPELRIKKASPDIKSIEEEITEEVLKQVQRIYSNTGITPQYLTVVGSPTAIPMGIFDEEMLNKLDYYLDNVGTPDVPDRVVFRQMELVQIPIGVFEEELSSQINSETAYGRIYGASSTDSTTTINKSIFYEDLKLHRNNSQAFIVDRTKLISTDGDDLIRQTYRTTYLPGTAYNLTKTGTKTLCDSTGLFGLIESVKSYGCEKVEAIERLGESNLDLLLYEGGHSPWGLKDFVYVEQIPELSSIIGIAPYFIKHNWYSAEIGTEAIFLRYWFLSEYMFDSEWLRKGGIAFYGKLNKEKITDGMTMRSSFGEDVLNELMNGGTLGKALRMSLLREPTEDNAEPFKDIETMGQAYTLIGDPTLTPGIFAPSKTPEIIRMQFIDPSTVKLYAVYSEENAPYSLEVLLFAFEEEAYKKADMTKTQIKETVVDKEWQLTPYIEYEIHLATEGLPSCQTWVLLELTDAKGLKTTTGYLVSCRQELTNKFLKASAHTGNREYSEAIELLKEIVTSAEDIEFANQARLRIGYAYTGMELYDKALTTLKEIPEDSFYYQQALKEIISIYTNSLYLSEENYSNALSNASALAQKIEDSRERKNANKKIEELSKDIQTYGEFIADMSTTIEFLEARQRALDAVKLFDNYGELTPSILDDVKGYLEFMKTIPQTHPLAKKALLEFADALDDVDLDEEALNAYNKYLVIYPNDEKIPYVRLEIAHLLKKTTYKDDYQQAIEEYRNLHLDSPETPEGMKALSYAANTAEEYDDYRQAITLYDEFSKKYPDPKNPESQEYLKWSLEDAAINCLVIHELGKAAEYFEKYIELGDISGDRDWKSNKSRITYYLAITYTKLNEYEKAKELFLQLVPEEEIYDCEWIDEEEINILSASAAVSSLVRVGRIYEEQGDNEKAIESYKEYYEKCRHSNPVEAKKALVKIKELEGK